MQAIEWCQFDALEWPVTRISSVARVCQRQLGFLVMVKCTTVKQSVLAVATAQWTSFIRVYSQSRSIHMFHKKTGTF